jgi:hypothetical protein
MRCKPTEERESVEDVFTPVSDYSRCSSPVAQVRDQAKTEDDGGISLTRRLHVANLSPNGLAQRPLPGISFG